MGLDAIKRKGAAMGKQTAQIIKVNKYENPQMALNLISHICTASSDLDLTPCFQPVSNLLWNQMKPDLEKYDLMNSNLITSCDWKLLDLQDELVSTMSSSLQLQEDIVPESLLYLIILQVSETCCRRVWSRCPWSIHT